jgi:hypothetical protein
VCEIIAALGKAVVPEVNRISQISSPWISTAGSATGWPAMKSVKEALPGTGPPPIVMVMATSRPLAANVGSAAGHSSASTTASRGVTSLIIAASMSGATIGLTGAQTSPALAAATLTRYPSIEFSQKSRTTSPRSRPRASSPWATWLAIWSACR